jgi:hypothetical protein
MRSQRERPGREEESSRESKDSQVQGSDQRRNDSGVRSSNSEGRGKEQRKLPGSRVIQSEGWSKESGEGGNPGGGGEAERGGERQ